LAFLRVSSFEMKYNAFSARNFMFNSFRIVLICTLFTAAVSLRADSSCIAASQNGIVSCGDEASRLSGIGGIEDVEWNLLGSGGGYFQAYFKPSSYNPPETGTPDVEAKSSDDSGGQYSGGGFPGGGDCCGPTQPPGWSGSSDNGSTGTPPDKWIGNIITSNGGGGWTYTPSANPDPIPEPGYSALLALGAGLLLLAGGKIRTVSNAVR
jgi:hypothetical protein